MNKKKRARYQPIQKLCVGDGASRARVTHEPFSSIAR